MSWCKSLEEGKEEESVLVESAENQSVSRAVQASHQQATLRMIMQDRLGCSLI